MSMYVSVFPNVPAAPGLPCIGEDSKSSLNLRALTLKKDSSVTEFSKKNQYTINIDILS